MADVELRFPPDAEFVGLARLVVTAAARLAGMTGDRVEDLKIAVSEAATNAVRAHLEGGADDPVVIRFGATNGAFSVTIADARPGYRPLGRDRGALAELEDGLGLQLIEELADSVAYGRTSGTTVRISFAVAPPSDPSESGGR